MKTLKEKLENLNFDELRKALDTSKLHKVVGVDKRGHKTTKWRKGEESEKGEKKEKGEEKMDTEFKIDGVEFRIYDNFITDSKGWWKNKKEDESKEKFVTRVKEYIKNNYIQDRKSLDEIKNKASEKKEGRVKESKEIKYTTWDKDGKEYEGSAEITKNEEGKYIWSSSSEDTNSEDGRGGSFDSPEEAIKDYKKFVKSGFKGRIDWD